MVGVNGRMDWRVNGRRVWGEVVLEECLPQLVAYVSHGKKRMGISAGPGMKTIYLNGE